MDALATARILLIHDWLTGRRGGEKVLEHFCRRWPAAPLYTVVHRRGSVGATIESHSIHASSLNRLPGVQHYYRYLLPLMPAAVQWRLPASDLVLSTSHCVAKGVTPPPDTPHVCYCLTPMRYAWQLRASYGWHGLKGWVIDKVLDRLRDWDRRTAAQVTHFIAISRAVQQRIRDCYGRDSVVIHPPVDTAYYCRAETPREDFYLAVSACAPYKRLDLAIAACNRLRRDLVVIGAGQDEQRLRSLAGPTVRFLGWQPDSVVRDQMRRCRALLFPGEEDFGIVPVEAQACGTPVVAYARGGALDTVQPLGPAATPTGVLFAEQTVECLADALTELESHREDFDPGALRSHALQFAAARFEREVFEFVGAVLRRDRNSIRHVGTDAKNPLAGNAACLLSESSIATLRRKPSSHCAR